MHSKGNAMIDNSWTLFLDRDGIINKQRQDGYIYRIEDFILTEGVVDGLKILRTLFGKIIIVTNQQCVGKGICTASEVDNLHRFLVTFLAEKDILIDKIYYCPHLATENCNCRKPNIGMADMAKNDFPDINFTKSLMVGDSFSDLLFGKRCGMKTAYIKSIIPIPGKPVLEIADYYCENILELAKILQ